MKKILLTQFLVLAFIWAYSQRVETINGIIQLSNRQKSSEEKSTEKIYFLLSYQNIPNENQLKEMHQQGLEIIQFLPPQSYIVKRNQSEINLDALIQKNFMYGGEIPIESKLSKDLYTYYLQKEIDSKKECLVSVYQKSDLDAFTNWLKKENISYRNSDRISNISVIIKIEAYAALEKLIRYNAVSFVEVYKAVTQEENRSSSMFSNQIFGLNYDRIGPAGRNTYFSNIEYYGANSLFTLNTKGRNHPLYGTNYKDNTSTLSPSHGTSVSMYAAASNNVDEYENRGMAEEAILVQMPRFDSIENYYTNHNLNPLTLNVSAGMSETSVDYNSEAREFDRITRTLKGFSLCFAAGNTGGDNNTSLNYGPGWANITGNHKTGKNTFTVHSAGKPGEHYDWACKGPTTDGRLKPDISAEGQFGTSYASPNLAGLVNVLYESYQNSYNASPRSDVVKAVILNTAIDADKPGIDFKSGFGTVNPSRADKIIREQKISTDILPQGSNHTRQYPLNVPAGLKQIRILLYWHDYPGTPGAARALVNDLDLQIIDPQSNTILPWVLDATPGNQYNLPLRKRDSLNNVEQITIENPIGGNYTIVVKGRNIPIGPQEFVVTYDLLPYHIEITSPVKNFRTGRNKTILFTWNAALDTTNSNNSIEIILQKQTNESTILASVPAKQKYYSYIVPGNFPYSSTARIIVRQKNTPYADTSDYFHVNETPSGLSFQKICKDQIELKWQASQVVGTEYIIYRLGEKYMQEVARVTYPATSINLNAQTILGPQKEFGKSEWFAIAAQHPNGAISLRSAPISSQQTNLLSNASPISKEYILCYGDAVVVRALDLQRDSLRWFYNSKPTSNNAQLTLLGKNRGDYFYKIYQQGGCIFTSDTFSIKGPLEFEDTLVYGAKNWNALVYKNNDRNLLYGKLNIKELSINSMLYYTEFDQINRAVGYEGCNPDLIYTISYKRKGFTKGMYKIDLHKVQYQIRIFLDENLIYTSPQNMTNIGTIWQGELNDTSRMRIEQLVQAKPIVNIEFIPVDYVAPGGVKDGLKVWLKGDKTSKDAQGKVKRWIDTQVFSLQNNAGKDANITTNSNAINYNEALVFDKSGGLFGALSNDIYEGSAISFGVFKMNATSGHKARLFSLALPSIYSDDDYYGTYIAIGRKDSTTAIGSFRKNNSILASGNRMDEWQMISTDVKPSIISIKSNGMVSATAAQSFPNFFYSRINIGAKADTIKNEGLLDGSIAEIIHYTKAISVLDEQKINSYLAIKYGFNLSHPYRSSSGKIIYHTGVFNKNIAGIAREDKQELLQKQSCNKDVFAGSIGEIKAYNLLNKTSISNDSSFVLWSSNGKALAYSVLQNDSSLRLQRVWKLRKTNFNDSFRFNFTDSVIAENETCTQYQLLIINPLDSTDIKTYVLSNYLGGDGKHYAYKELVLTDDSIYFSISKKNLNLENKPLEKFSYSDRFCRNDSSLLLIDSTEHYCVANMHAPSLQATQINNIKIYTNANTDALAFCTDTTRISVLNRFIEINSTNLSGIQYTLELFREELDSIDAANNQALQTFNCKPFRNNVKWFAETDTNTLYQKIREARTLQWIADSNIQYLNKNNVNSVLIKNIQANNYVLGAALFDTSMRVIQVGVPLESIGNILVHPNPFSTELYLENVPPNSFIELYNNLGQCIYKEKYPSKKISIPNTLTGSIYYLRILMDGAIIYNTKLINKP